MAVSKFSLNYIGCTKCGYERVRYFNDKIKTTDNFVKLSKQIHGDKYDYSKSIYLNKKTKIIIICKKHGEILQYPNVHAIRGHGCKQCFTDRNPINQFKTNDTFLIQAKNKHGYDYDYLSEYKSCFEKIKIKCKKCENIFYQTPANHLFGQTCPNCNLSKGEKKIEYYLKSKNIEYVIQKWFFDCRGIRWSLPFDFYLPKYNLLIEYDGRQHVEIVDFSHGTSSKKELLDNFNNVKINESIKTQYCISNNINLLRIHYKDINNIPKILESYLNKLTPINQ